MARAGDVRLYYIILYYIILYYIILYYIKKCKDVKLSVHQGLDFDLTLCIGYNFRVNVLFYCSSDTMISSEIY